MSTRPPAIDDVSCRMIDRAKFGGASCRTCGKSISRSTLRYVEQTPDTVVCCDTGEKVMVKENLQEVVRRAIEYARVIRRPITD